MRELLLILAIDPTDGAVYAVEQAPFDHPGHERATVDRTRDRAKVAALREYARSFGGSATRSTRPAFETLAITGTAAALRSFVHEHVDKSWRVKGGV